MLRNLATELVILNAAYGPDTCRLQWGLGCWGAGSTGGYSSGKKPGTWKATCSFLLTGDPLVGICPEDEPLEA